MTEERPEIKIDENAKNIPIEETHDWRRILEFVEKKPELNLSEENLQQIKNHLKQKEIRNFADITSKAEARARRGHIPFMDAVSSVVEDNKKPKRRMLNPDEYKAFLAKKREERQRELLPQKLSDGLRSESNKVGYRSDAGLSGSLATPRIPEGSGQREENFKRALTDPDKKKEE